MQAYLKPTVHRVDEQFAWGRMDVQRLVPFLEAKLLWTRVCPSMVRCNNPSTLQPVCSLQEQVVSHLQPVLKAQSDRNKQMTMDSFVMKYDSNIKAATVRGTDGDRNWLFVHHCHCCRCEASDCVLRWEQNSSTLRRGQQQRRRRGSSRMMAVQRRTDCVRLPR